MDGSSDDGKVGLSEGSTESEILEPKMKRKTSIIGSTLSKFKSLKEEEMLKFAKKSKKALESSEKKKKRKLTRGKSGENVNSGQLPTTRSSSQSLDGIPHISATRTSTDIKRKSDSSSQQFNYNFVETKDDSFLDGDTPSTSPSTSRSTSRVNSKEEIQEQSEETAANRRAKFLQRYGSSISPDSSRDDVNSRSSITLEHDNIDDPHADRICGSNKKFHKRFKMPEETVIEDFLCALLLRGTLLAQGSMYITHNYVCFYANIFGKKTRVTIPFREIISVRKCKILKSIPNSIEIHTMEKKYFWASFLHRENAFQLIDQRWRLIRKKMGSPVIDDVRPLDSDDSVIEWGVDGKSDLGYDWRDSDDFGQMDDCMVMGDSFPPLSPVCCHQVERSEASMAAAPRYTEKFPISVQDFYLNFLSDGSDNFWTEFHSRDGYTGFSMTKWSSSLEGCCLERHTDFKAPIRMSLAPKHTRVTQKQRCRFTSPDEIIFETSSHSRDVPYSNQFLVDAVWKLTNLPDGGCELNISVFVRFTKKNWLKSMIERNAVEGSRDWFENWIYSALEVAKHIKHNSSVPHSLRTSATDILAKSIGHSHSRTEEDNTTTTVAKTEFMGGKEKLLMIVLLVAALCFLCSSVYFFWS